MKTVCQPVRSTASRRGRAGRACCTA